MVSNRANSRGSVATETTTTDPWAVYIYAFKAPATFIDLRERGSGNNLSSNFMVY